MNDRQRLEAIVSVVCKYLPPDGISKNQAINEIISLVDPLPKQEQGEPVALPLNETEEMHDAVMSVLYEGVARTNTDALWKAYRKVLVTTPQQRKPLTCFDTEKLAKQCGVEWTTRIDKLCKLAAAHGIKEKNT